MTSKAERLKLKRLSRGRAPFPGPREPNGRLSRTILRPEHEAAATTTAIEARMRLYDLPRASAAQDLAGTTTGRLVLAGTLARHHHEAAGRYLEILNAYTRAINAKPLYETHPPDDELAGTYEEFCCRAIAAHAAMREAIEAAARNTQRANGLWLTLEICVVRDVWFEQLEPDLRHALTALARHFGLQEYGTAERAA